MGASVGASVQRLLAYSGLRSHRLIHTPARFELLSSLCGCVLVVFLVPLTLCYASLVLTYASQGLLNQVADRSSRAASLLSRLSVSQVPMLADHYHLCC